MAGAEVDVLIVGGGHNGLVAGCYLGQAGVKAQVLEAQPNVGGMSSTEYPIPEAPDHAVHPGAIDLFFMRGSTVIEDLELAEAGLSQIVVDPAYVYLDPNGGSIAFWRDPRKTAAEIERFSQRDAGRYLELHYAVDAVVKIAADFLSQNPARPAPSAVARAAVQALGAPRDLLRSRSILMSTPEETLNKYFSHPIVRDAVAAMVGVGGPLTTASMSPSFMIMPFCQRFGVGRPVGGMQALMGTLVRRLESYGGSVRTSARVAEILVQNNKATGVRLTNGEVITARLGVIGACDPRVTLEQLLPAGSLPSRMQRRVGKLPANGDRCGTLKVDVALSGRLQLTRHEKWRGDGVDLRRPAILAGTMQELNESRIRAAEGDLYEPIPACYVIPNAVDATQTPDGQDVLYFWSGVAPLRPSVPVEEYRAKAEQAAIRTSSQFYDGIEELMIGTRVEAAEDLEKRYSATNGCIVHVDWGWSRMGPLRPTRGLGGYRTPVKGLYLAGAGTHPGGGVGGYSGRNSALAVLKDARRKRGGSEMTSAEVSDDRGDLLL